MGNAAPFSLQSPAQEIHDVEADIVARAVVFVADIPKTGDEVFHAAKIVRLTTYDLRLTTCDLRLATYDLRLFAIFAASLSFARCFRPDNAVYATFVIL